ncbi:ORF056 [Saltwater crocodilepox virus]|nr:RING-like motif protein [Saltwater crocodilepox virus]AVD69391.1 RING-like motif protein [Saltwater crocodilepox virus]QGT46495.1 ORF056 [Saltwater crocodilepox virus]QGT46711.1 ORF056 [Saltwater crocodilepox virus]QGT46928.1 ORF056 [Saltwater crocodilepox virus]
MDVRCLTELDAELDQPENNPLCLYRYQRITLAKCCSLENSVVTRPGLMFNTHVAVLGNRPNSGKKTTVVSLAKHNRDSPDNPGSIGTRSGTVNLVVMRRQLKANVVFTLIRNLPRWINAVAAIWPGAKFSVYDCQSACEFDQLDFVFVTYCDYRRFADAVRGNRFRRVFYYQPQEIVIMSMPRAGDTLVEANFTWIVTSFPQYVVTSRYYAGRSFWPARNVIAEVADIGLGIEADLVVCCEDDLINVDLRCPVDIRRVRGVEVVTAFSPPVPVRYGNFSSKKKILGHLKVPETRLGDIESHLAECPICTLRRRPRGVILACCFQAVCSDCLAKVYATKPACPFCRSFICPDRVFVVERSSKTELLPLAASEISEHNTCLGNLAVVLDKTAVCMLYVDSRMYQEVRAYLDVEGVECEVMREVSLMMGLRYGHLILASKNGSVRQCGSVSSLNDMVVVLKGDNAPKKREVESVTNLIVGINKTQAVKVTYLS